MKKIQKVILGILIIILITILCILMAIKVGNKNTIQKQLEETQKLTETREENSFVKTTDHLTEVNSSVQSIWESIRNSEVLSGKTDIAGNPIYGNVTDIESLENAITNDNDSYLQKNSCSGITIPRLVTGGNGSAGGVYDLSFDIADCNYSNISIDRIAFGSQVWAPDVCVRVYVTTSTSTIYLINQNGSKNTISNFKGNIPEDAKKITFESHTNATGSDRNITWTNIVIE